MKQDSPEASDLYQKARLLMDKNKFEDAAVLFQKSAEISPHFKTLELLGECYIHLNRLQKAIIPLAAAVSLNKGVRAAALLSEVFFKLKDLKAAKDLVEIALSREENNRKALKIKVAIENIDGD